METQQRKYTYEEAEKEGLEHSGYPEVACEHCGKRIVFDGILGPGSKVYWVLRRPCGCEGSKLALKRQEEEEKKRVISSAKETCLKSGISERYIGAKISRPESARYISNFAKEKGAGLYLVGPVGAGKTYEASAIAKAFIWSHYSVIFTTAIGLLSSLKKGFGDKADPGLTPFCTTDLLILDDLGKEIASSWAMTSLFQVINSRYDSLRPIIFTSQYPLDALERRLARNGEKESAEAIASRIEEMCTVVQLKSGDRRRRKVAAYEQETLCGF